MRISVIIPNFCDLRIDRALTAINSQTYTDFEIVVVHGGPLSAELQEIYSRHEVDTLIHEPDKGIFDALNKGIQHATGDLVYLQGADDYLSGNEIFKDVVGKFYNESNLDGVCIGCVFVSGKGAVIRSWYPSKVSAKMIKRGIFPPHFSLFLKKEVYNVVGPFKFEETSNVATDIIWLMDLSIKKKNFKITTLLEHHLNMEYGGASTGSWKAIWRQFKIVHKYAVINRNEVSYWLLFSLIRSGSKILQFFGSKKR